MAKLEEFLTEYFSLWLGVEGMPQGLAHNTQWGAFIGEREASSILLKYDSTTNKLFIDGESKDVIYFLFIKKEGSFAENSPIDLLSIFVFESIVEIETMLLAQVSNCMQKIKNSEDLLILNRVSAILKSDLLDNTRFMANASETSVDAIYTLDDEVRLQERLIELNEGNRDSHQKVIDIIKPLIPYVNAENENSPAETKTATELFIIALKSLFDLKDEYNQSRTLRIIQIMSDLILERAQLANSKLDLFEYENYNLRLRLSMWQEIMKTFISKAWKIVEALRGKAKPLPEVVKYQTFLKKISAANYLRGIYDELIRFCRLKRHVECDMKLIKFNERRKSEKKTSKEEREEFFKEFGNYIMEIISYIDTDLMKNYTSHPKETLLQIRCWSNTINLKKSHETVEKIKTMINEGSDVFFSAWNKSLEELEKIDGEDNISKEMSAVINWAGIKKEFIEIKEVYFDLLDDFDKEANMKRWNSFKNIIRDKGKELLDKWEQQYVTIKQQDSKTFNEILARTLVYEEAMDKSSISIELSMRSDSLYEEAVAFNQYEMGSIADSTIRNLVSEAISYRSSAVAIKQVSIQYNFIIQSMIPCLRNSLISSPPVLDLFNLMKSKTTKGLLVFNNTIDSRNFSKRCIVMLQEIKRKSLQLESIYTQNVQEIRKLGNYNLVSERDFAIWRSKKSKAENTVKELSKDIEEHNLAPIKEELSNEMQSVLQARLKVILASYSDFVTEKEIHMRLKDGRAVPEQSPNNVIESWNSELLGLFDKWSDIGVFERESLIDEELLANNAIKGEFERLKSFLENPEELSHINSIMGLFGKIKSNVEQDWNTVVNEITEVKAKLDRIPDHIQKGKINIGLKVLKSDAFSIILDMREDISSALNSSLHKDIQEINEFMLNSQVFLKSKPDDFEVLDRLRQSYESLKDKYEQYYKKLDTLEARMRMVRDLELASVSDINFSNIRRKWDNFSLKFSCFNQILREGEKSILGEIKSDLSKMNPVVDKFYEKIKSVDVSSRKNMSKEEEESFATVLKEIKSEWDDIYSTIGPHLSNIEKHNMDVSDLTSLQAVLDYFKGPFAEWSVYFEFVGGIEIMEKEEWISFKANAFDFQKYILEWMQKIEEKEGTSYKFIRDQCERYKEIWPGIKAMIGEGFQRQHWAELFDLLQISKKRQIAELTFRDILTKREQIIKNIDAIKFLASKALGEVALRETLADLGTWCDTTKYEFSDFKDQQGVELQLVKEWSDIITRVSENQVMLQSVRDSKYASGFKDQLEAFEIKLSGLDENLIKLNQVQRKWVYLEPVFGRGALPSEQGRFRRLDDEFRNIMITLARQQVVVSLSEIPGISDSLEMLIDQLDRCQKALNTYLEEKRDAFPRFFFLGDDDLLEILGQSQNTEVVATHLKKIFSGISNLQTEGAVEKNTLVVKAIVSDMKEVVKLNSKITVSKSIEEWLEALSLSSSSQLKALLSSSYKEEVLDIENYPGQVLLVKELVTFSNLVEKGIAGGSLKNIKSTLDIKLGEFTGIKHKLNKLGRSKVKNMILDLIHNIAVVEELINSNINSKESWGWLRQLKYYDEGNGNTSMMICKAKFEYTFEYQGNAGKLVHTPLTDKCYLTLTQGMLMGYGGNPYGPAGTGKTESVKALGQAFGRQVLVFNCDEGIDYQSMARIFTGLVRCGSWGCFDEFNRLKADQLSAVSQQIQVIQNAIKVGDSQLDLLGRTISVNSNAGIFVTMNPAGKGYGGRSKLPDNLKQLFRPVAMSKPDNELIAEVLLYSEGFKSAKSIAKKVVSLFLFSSQLLSSQQHYDWGLRALKTILIVTGELMQSARDKNQEINDSKESEFLIQAVRVNTLSKLTFADSKKFESLLECIFVGSRVKDVEYKELEDKVREVLKEKDLEFDVRQVNKIKQFYEATRQRMGVVLIGPSGCGKTTIWQVLKESMHRLGEEVKLHVMNPKSVSRTMLLGYMNHDTREFNDGILTSVSKTVSKETSEARSWIICDGDVDPEWIESLNSVLDDNHLLTLPNGERISFNDHVNFIFETHDLQFASLATVSRMGMIYLNNEDINIRSVTLSWTKGLGELQKNYISKKILEKADSFVKLLIKHEQFMPVKSTMVGLLKIMLSQLRDVKSDDQLPYALYKGLTAAIIHDKRDLLKKEMESMMNCIVEQKISSAIEQFDDKIVLTEEIKSRIDYIIPWAKNGEPFIIAGPEGSGKETIVRGAFGQLRDENIKIVKIHCSSQLTAKQVIEVLLEHCVKASVASGRMLRPKDVTRLVIFFKDINLPKPDKYATTEVIALLQQILTYNGFYDGNLEYLSLDKNIQIVASLNPSGSYGRYSLSERFTAKINIFYITYLEKKEMGQVFFKIVKALLDDIGVGSNEVAKTMTVFVTELFEMMGRSFVSQKYSHYVFTPSDVINIVNNIRNFEIENDDDCLVAIYVSGREVFGNKLACEEDRSNFEILIKQKFTSVNVDKSKLIDSIITYSSLLSTPDSSTLARVDREKYIKKLESEKISYEKENEEMPLFFSNEFLDLCLSIEHLLLQGRSILLAGESGNGRRTATRYIGFLTGYTFKTIYMTINYTERDFRRDIKKILEYAGILNKKTILLVEDQHFECESNLDLINTFLASGDFPGVIKEDDIEQSIGKEGVEELKRESISNKLYEGFLARIRRNLRVVISLDHTSEKFLGYISANPSLTKECGVVWTHPWGLKSKKQYLIETLKGQSEPRISKLSEDDFLLNCLIKIHSDSKTPNLLFFRLIAQFIDAIRAKLNNMGSQHKHLKNGLQKITEANEDVQKLSEKAVVSRKELQKKEKEADDALDHITKAMELAAVQKSEAIELKKFLQEEEGKIQGKKEQVEGELDEIRPTVEAAKKDLKSVKKGDLNELVSYNMIPQPIVDVFTALMRLMGHYDNSLSSIKRFFKQRSVLEEIINFDARTVTEKNRSEAEKIIKKCPTSFDRETIYSVSKAAGPIALYVVALVKLSKIMLNVKPLQDELDEVEEKLKSSKKKLKDCENKVKELDKQTEQYKVQHKELLTDAERLKVGLEKVESTLSRATHLLGKLTDEQARWDEQLKTISEEVKGLPLFSLLSSSFVCFLSDKDEREREKRMDSWCGLCRGAKFDYIKFSYTESITLKWKSEGHPTDILSIQNTGIYLQSISTPLIIDPSTSIISWIKKRSQGEKTFEAVSFANPKFATHFELAIRFGKVLVVEEANTLEGMYYPMLRNDLIRVGARRAYLVGEKVIDYNEGFRLVLATRDVTLKVHPKARSLLSIINYSVTKSGLEMQLLSIVVNNERPELEQRKTEILNKEESLKMQLSEVEQQLLNELVKSEGDLLNNQKLIDSLEEAKKQSTTISQSLKESASIQQDIDKERNMFRGLASEGAKYYLLLKEVSNLSHMHRYSLQFFLKKFKDTLAEPRKSGAEGDGFISALTMNLFENLIKSICFGLSNRLRLSIVLFLIHGGRPEQFKDNEWEFFMGELIDTGSSTSGLPRWLPAILGEELGLFRRQFPTISRSTGLDSNADDWKDWYESPDCENKFKSSWGLSPFNKVMLTKLLREERTQASVLNFIEDQLKDKQTLFPKMSLEYILENESSPDTPVLFIITPGSDPSQELEKFSNERIGADKLLVLSMGGGRNDAALNLIRLGAEQGAWVFLTNLHLVPEFLMEIEKTLSSIEKKADFRLWATTEEHENFPAIMLERCFKVYFETPPGIKKNIERAYAMIEEKNISASTASSALTFVLSTFHSIVQERRNFVPQGWSKAYEFSYADFKAAFQLFETLDAREITDDFIEIYSGLLENAIYGGRVDSSSDMLVLRTYLKQIFCKDILNGKTEILPGVRFSGERGSQKNLEQLSILPDVDSPSTFGLPKTVDISVQKFAAKQIIENIRTLKSGKSEVLGFDKDIWKKGLMPLIKLWKTLQKDLNDVGHREISEVELAVDDPIESFILSELHSGFIAISRLSEQIKSLVRVIKGEIPLNPALSSLGIDLLISRLPVSWRGIWDGPEVPLEWLRQYFKKMVAMHGWIKLIRAKNLLKETLSLSDLFSPEVFLNAHRVIVSKETGIPMEQLKLILTFAPPSTQSTSLKIGGLFVQGCSVSGGKLCDLSIDESREFIEMPICYISYSKYEEQAINLPNMLSVPLYNDLTREKLISHFDIEITGDKAKKIISGVAMSINI